MTALARGDERRILRFVAEADGFGGAHPFEGEFLTQLGTLVPAQWIGLDHGREHDPASPNYCGRDRPGDEHVFDHVDWREAFQFEMPAFDYLERNFGAVKLSDFWSRRELRRSLVYNLVLQPAGLEHVLAVRLPMAPETLFIFDRGDRDFSERDREVLLTLSPHLVRLYELAGLRKRLQVMAPPLAELTPREREVLELVAEGHANGEIASLLWISSGTVRKHLDNIYAKLGVHTRTAAASLLRG
jgi:DNA-binding CsgD family transcriptional regulator